MEKLKLDMDVASDLLHKAIKEGVKEAFHEMMESGNGFTGPIRTEQVMQAIKEGVKEAFLCLDITINPGNE